MQSAKKCKNAPNILNIEKCKEKTFLNILSKLLIFYAVTSHAYLVNMGLKY